MFFVLASFLYSYCILISFLPSIYLILEVTIKENYSLYQRYQIHNLFDFALIQSVNLFPKLTQKTLMAHQIPKYLGN